MTEQRKNASGADRPAEPDSSSGPSRAASPGLVAAILRAPGRWLLGAAILVAVIWWVQQAIGWREALAPWQTLPAASLLLAITLLAVSYVVRAVRLLVYFPGLPLWPTVRLSTQHTAANNLLPMRLGEAVFPILMKRFYGYRLRRGAVSLAWLRFFDLHTVLVVGCLAAWLIGRQPAWLVIAITLLLGLYAGVVLRGRIRRRFEDGPDN
ncbi:MAG: flippase-like domain-containing protein, partial [Gammaproteobacteria bacterium]|nr:flippase-like domain-containing protein [Gammaproteobacteria bacterium]